MSIQFAPASQDDVDSALEKYSYPRSLLENAREQLQFSREALTELPMRIAQIHAEINAIDPSNQKEISRKREQLELIQASLEETPANIVQFENDIAALEEMVARADSIESSPMNDLLTLTIKATASKNFLKEYKEKLQALLENNKYAWKRSFLTQLIAKIDQALNFKTMGETSDVTLVLTDRELNFLPPSARLDIDIRHAEILSTLSPPVSSKSKTTQKKNAFTPSYNKEAANNNNVEQSNALILRIIKTRVDSLQNALSRKDRAKWKEILSKSPPATLTEQLNNIDGKSELGKLIGINAIYEQALIQQKKNPNKSVSIHEAAIALSVDLSDKPNIQKNFESSISMHTSSYNPKSMVMGSQFSQLMSKIEGVQKRHNLPRDTFRGFDTKRDTQIKSKPKP